MIHRATPPGYITTPWVPLGMSRANFYQSHLIDLWKSGPLIAYKTTGTTQILYAADDVTKLKYWLLVRSGLIALDEMPINSPLVPPFDILSWFDEDPNGVACPQCGEPAVEGKDGRVWCQRCGVSND